MRRVITFHIHSTGKHAIHIANCVFRIISKLCYQDHNDQGIMVLVKEQIYLSTEPSRNPEIDPHRYGQVIFNKEAKLIQWRKNTFSTNGSGTIERQYGEKMNIDIGLTSFIKLTKNGS